MAINTEPTDEGYTILQGVNKIIELMKNGGGSGGGGLPEVDDSDNGKLLTVVDGEWAAASGGGGGGDSWKKVLYTDNVSFTMGSWDHGQINGTALLQQFPGQAVNIKELTVNEKTYTNVAIFPRANAETPDDATTKKIESNLPDGIDIDIIVGVDWNDNDEFFAKITMDTVADPLPTVTASAIIEGFTFGDELYSAYIAINW